MKNSPLALICFWLCLITGFAAATSQTIAFYSYDGDHRKANLQPVGADCFIEVGAFTVGFDPASQPRSSWKADWHPLKRLAYDTQEQEYEGLATIDNNTAPFTTSNRIWVWIYDSSGNWCLYGNTSWTWPDTSFPLQLLPVECAPELANETPAGSTVFGSQGFTCELVTDAASPGLTFVQWAELTLPEGFRTKNGDHDKDGQNNLIEYAFGTDPDNANSFSTTVIVKQYSGQPYLAALVNKGWTTGLTYTVQWSDNLSNWQTTGLTTIVNNFASLEIRDGTVLGTETRRFLRVHVLSPD